MLSIFDGRPGDGKSYSAVALKILPHLAAGGYVATNIEMLPEGVAAFILKRTGKVFNPARLRILSEDEAPRFHRFIPPGNEEVRVLVVIDEAHLFFNARDWAKSDKDFRDTFNLATQHRKYFLDIILVSQHFGNIDAQFLRLIEELWRFRDLAKWRFPVPGLKWIRIPYFRFLSIVFDRNGKTIMGRNWLPFDKLVGAAYNTRAVSRGSQMEGSVEKIELARDPVFTARLAKIQKLAGIALAVIAVSAAGWIAYVYGRNTVEPEQREFDRIKAENERLRLEKQELLTRPTVARPAAPASATVQTPATPKPEGWLDLPPKAEIIKFSTLGGSPSKPRLIVLIDGVTQVLEIGAHITRGRVMQIGMLHARLYDVDISDDNSVRHRIRCVLQDIPVTGSSNPLMKTDDKPNANVPGTVANPALQNTEFGGYSLGL